MLKLIAIGRSIEFGHVYDVGPTSHAESFLVEELDVRVTSAAILLSF
jgi:hypothetical protein